MNSENNRQIVILNIDDILPNRFQPRIKFNDQAINELAESIKLYGVIQPIVVRKISDKYEIIAGERRYKASIIAGKTTIPAIITDLDDKNGAEVALIENIQRQDLTPIEEAISYKKILDMGYISQGELGEKLGKNQSTIANKLRLLNLNDEVQEALMENKISERHARSLLKLDDKKQILMLNRIINERLTVRKTDEEIDKLLHNVDNMNNKEEKGEEIMNNDILKEFNIPTNPIEEDKTDDSILFDLENKTENNNINPGFMDLNKIKNEAQDIITEPTPTADMGELLKTTEPVQPIINEMQQPNNEIEQQPAKSGKFFNFFNFGEPTQDENFVENIEEKQTNMDFNEPINNPLNIFKQEEDLIDKSNIDITPINKEIKEEPVYEKQIIETIEPISHDVPQFEDTIHPISLTDEADFVSENTNLSNDNVSSINEDIINPVQKSYMLDENVTFDDEGEIEVKLNNSNESITKADMKTVINTIRECAAQIEKFGYKIDTDEIDLENYYEVTFHIQKED